MKNLRGVVLLSPEEDVKELVDWFVSKFRYRNLGVPPSGSARLKELLKGGLSGGPFVELVYPVEPVEELVRVAGDTLGVGFEVAEAVVLASCYVSPVIALGEEADEKLTPLSVDEVASRVKLDNSGWRLHLRIADYSVLDLHSWSVEHSLGIWRGADDGAFIEERSRRIRLDRRRYWRLARGQPSGEWRFLRYLDVARQIIAKGEKGRLRELSKDAAAGLAIETAVIVKRSNIPL